MDPFWEDAIKRGAVETIQGLIERGADIDARDAHSQTGLMLAAHAGNLALAEALIAHGAALDVTAKYGLSALMLAVVAGHVDVARALARAGCDLAIRGSGAPGFSNKTASDLAAASGKPELAADLAPDG